MTSRSVSNYGNYFFSDAFEILNCLTAPLCPHFVNVKYIRIGHRRPFLIPSHLQGEVAKKLRERTEDFSS